VLNKTQLLLNEDQLEACYFLYTNMNNFATST